MYQWRSLDHKSRRIEFVELAHYIRVCRWKCLYCKLRRLSLMSMHNPPQPGEFIQATYLEPYNISGRHLAAKLNVAASTLNRVLNLQSGISPEMALRLS